LRGIGGKIDEVRSPLCLGIEVVKFLLLSIQKQADGELNKIWFDMKEDVACKNILSFTYKVLS